MEHPTEPQRSGRPRSEQAREAVLRAVEDLLMEQGYAAMTFKSIAERAGVSRQTIYRWWTTKAEILFEACLHDAAQELAVIGTGEAPQLLAEYVGALLRFLTASPTGAAYRTLLGEAQHDREVAGLMAEKDVLAESAWQVLSRVMPTQEVEHARAQVIAQLVGPPFFWVMSGRTPDTFNIQQFVEGFLLRSAVT